MKIQVRNQKPGANTIAILSTLLIATSFMGCSNHIEKPVKQEVVSAIQPPLPGLEKQFSDYSLTAEAGDTIITPSGTQIIIPPNSIVDKAGNKVTGTIKIKYREYHDAIDAYLAGIPMYYISQGEKRYMQTAGMFEIRASKGETKLHLAKGKPAKILLASNEEGADYDFFNFNEKTNQWDYSNYPATSVNPKYVAIKQNIDSMPVVPQIPFKSEKFILNYLAFLDVYFNNNKSKSYKEYSKSSANKAEKYGLNRYDLWCNQVRFNGKKYPAGMLVWEKLSGDDFSSKLNFRTCVTKKAGKNTYYLSIKDNSGQKITMKAKCVMLLTDLFSSTSEEWKKKYKTYLVDLKENEKVKATLTKVFKVVELADFGIYNCDRLRLRENTFSVLCDFSLKGTLFNEDFPPLILCFPGDGKTLMYFCAKTTSKIYLNPNDMNFRLFSVIDSHTIAIFSPSDYRKINFKLLAHSEPSQYNFVLKTMEKTISSEQDVRDLLGTETKS